MKLHWLNCHLWLQITHRARSKPLSPADPAFPAPAHTAAGTPPGGISFAGQASGTALNSAHSGSSCLPRKTRAFEQLEGRNLLAVYCQGSKYPISLSSCCCGYYYTI